MEDGFDDFAVGARQDLAEDGAGNLHKEGFALGAIQARGLKPGRVGVDADPGLHALEKFVPGIRVALAPSLSAVVIGEKRKPYAISTDVKKLWKAGPICIFLQSSGFCPRWNALPCPCRSVRGPSGIAGPSYRRF